MPAVFSKEVGVGMLAGASIAALSFFGAYYAFKKHEKEAVDAAAKQAAAAAVAAIVPAPGSVSAGPVALSAQGSTGPAPMASPDVGPLSPLHGAVPPPATPIRSQSLGSVLGSGELLESKTALASMAAERDRLARLLRLAEASNVDTTAAAARAVLGGAAAGAGAGASAGRGLLSPSEIETLRGIFNLFDTKQEGKISVSEVKALHAKLGEPLTDAEAAATIKSLDRDGSGVVTFDKFLLWWYENHKTGRKGDQYTARFKLISAKLTAADGEKEAFDLSKLVVKPAGDVTTPEYRLFYYYKMPNHSLKPISVWHDVPLHHLGRGASAQIFNFICEIPKWTRAKFEIATGEPFNPIKQDMKHGKLRFQKYGDYMVNYGAFPQTWEDPKHVSPETKMKGDNDPIDVCEIGTRQLKSGAVVPVKILGILALIDDGETDWKVIAIQISDPLAHLLNDIDDVDVHLPGALDAIRTYLRDYKSGDGIINNFALGGQAMPRAFATKIVLETHEHWRALHVNDGKSTV